MSNNIKQENSTSTKVDTTPVQQELDDNFLKQYCLDEPSETDEKDKKKSSEKVNTMSFPQKLNYFHSYHNNLYMSKK